MRRVLVVVAVLAVALGLLSAPALAHHDHQLTNPSGCHTIPVGHQAHTSSDPGRKFHGAAHDGPAVEVIQSSPLVVRLGNGNSQVTVQGGAC